jgi:hypothetical protein
MNNYKTYGLSLIMFLSFIAVGFAHSYKSVKIEIKYTVQDTIPKQRAANAQNNKNKEQQTTDGQGVATVKSVPRARRQAKPKIVKPNIDIIRPVRPKIKPVRPKSGALRVKV